MNLKARSLVWIVAALVVALALWFIADRINRLYRKSWRFVASMQDLPPLDRATLRTPPVAWTSETRETQAATPEGLKPIRVTYSVNSLGMRLVRVEAGAFRMGLSDALAEAVGPREPMGGPMYTPHEVRITRPFYIGAFEVTNAQYEQFDPQHARRRPDYQRGAAGDNHPVDPVTWQDAQRFCRWLSQCEGRVYRLPTEAEWEYACRAGTTNRTYWGDDSHDRTKANLGYGVKAKRLRFAEDGFEFTAPVGSFPPNPWGLYDMIGNAWEWAQDWYRPGTNAPAVDPRGPPTGHCRVAKGGGWNTSLWSVSSALRDGDDPDDLKDARGFRVVCETADAPP